MGVGQEERFNETVSENCWPSNESQVSLSE